MESSVRGDKQAAPATLTSAEVPFEADGVTWTRWKWQQNAKYWNEQCIEAWKQRDAAAFRVCDVCGKKGADRTFCAEHAPIKPANVAAPAGEREPSGEVRFLQEQITAKDKRIVELLERQSIQPAPEGLRELVDEWESRARNMRAEHFYDTADSIELMIGELRSALRSVEPHREPDVALDVACTCPNYGTSHHKSDCPGVDALSMGKAVKSV